MENENENINILDNLDLDNNKKENNKKEKEKKEKKEQRTISFDEAKKLYMHEISDSPDESPYKQFVMALFGENELSIQYTHTLQIPGILSKKNYSILNAKHNPDKNDYFSFNKKILRLLESYENNPKYWGKQNVYLMLNNWLINDFNK
jgi:hypothetical protein